MQEEQIEKIALTTRQILLYLVDVAVAAFEPFDARKLYRRPIEDYFNWRKIDKKRFSDDLKRLEREGVIKIYLENNQSIIELSHKGKNKIRPILAKEYQYHYPKKWDGKWRIVIFDIPEKKKLSREVFRQKIREIGFSRLQKSVFVFPFDCKDMIDYLKELLGISPFVQYIVAEMVETQVDLLNYFLKKGLLNKTMIVKKR